MLVCASCFKVVLYVQCVRSFMISNNHFYTSPVMFISPLFLRLICLFCLLLDLLDVKVPFQIQFISNVAIFVENRLIRFNMVSVSITISASFQSISTKPICWVISCTFSKMLIKVQQSASRRIGLTLFSISIIVYVVSNVVKCSFFMISLV